jgi:hypothetical protein
VEVTGNVPQGSNLSIVGEEQTHQGASDEEYFKFPIDEAETTLMGLLGRREAIKSVAEFDLDDEEFIARHDLDEEWISHSRTAYKWATRSPLAIVLCGLLARAASEDVDPLSLQQSSGDYGYNASGLWKEVIVKLAGSHISLRQLKDQPFNNSPFNGKRRLGTDWESMSSRSVVPIAQAYAMLTEVEQMDSKSAERALLSFLLAAPNPASLSVESPDLLGEVPQLSVDLVEFCDSVATFIKLNSDDGRRAQAFVTAAIEVALPGRVTTPASIHDPSRTSPGDVKTHKAHDVSSVGPFYVEVKDKPVRAAVVRMFLESVRSFDVNASAGYAAFANGVAAEKSLDEGSRIPSAEELTRSSGIPCVVWRSPLDLMSQVVSWSGLPVSKAIWLCAHNYRKWLRHIDTEKAASPAEWDKYLLAWGFLDAE